MSHELFAALAGAVVGAGISGVIALLLWGLGEAAASRRTVRQARSDLAREIVRLRGDQAALAGALNELPVLFGEDEEIMALYRQLFVPGVDKIDAIRPIVLRMGKAAGGRDLQPDDLLKFLNVPREGTPPVP